MPGGRLEVGCVLRPDRKTLGLLRPFSEIGEQAGDRKLSPPFINSFQFNQRSFPLQRSLD